MHLRKDFRLREVHMRLNQPRAIAHALTATPILDQPLHAEGIERVRVGLKRLARRAHSEFYRSNFNPGAAYRFEGVTYDYDNQDMYDRFDWVGGFHTYLW